MAPPANRRTGHSRRAQYGSFFGYLAGVLGALIGIALLILSIRNPGFFSEPRSVAAQAVEPAGAVNAQARDAGRNVFSVLEGYALAGARYDSTRRELELARSKLAESEAIKAENRRLKRLLGIAESASKPVGAARLVGSSAASSRRYATIGLGRGDGVAEGMPVRSHLGLVGRILEAGRASSRVLLLTDTQSLVPVRRAQDDVAAFAQGRGDGTLVVRLISLGVNPLRKGDVLVTSGAGGLYRTGIPVAVVTALTSDGALARVLSDPAATDYVLVEPASAQPALVSGTAPAAAPAASTGGAQ
jgi:rod shape-determining protein MreC